MTLHTPAYTKWILSLLLIAGLSPIASYAAEENQVYEKQRILFEQAEHAIKNNQLNQYQKIKLQLKDYPLLPYLEYQAIKRKLHLVPASDIQEFVALYSDTPLAIRLLEQWLKTLAQRGEWQTLVDNYFVNDDLKLQCQFALALYKTKNNDRANIITKDLWLNGHSLPASCDLPVQNFQDAGKLTNELIWQRIQLAMKSDNVQLIRYLGKMLPEEERFWIAIWEKVRRTPDYLLEVSSHFKENEKDSEVLHWIAVYGLRRLASRDPLLAADYREKLQQQFPFTAEEQARIERRLILNLVQQDSDEANVWLQKMKFSRISDDVINAYIFNSIRDEDWELAFEWLQRLSPEEQYSERGHYWRGRILESMGQLEESRSAYLLNTDARGYYSFLSADRSGSDYSFSHRPLSFSDTELKDIKTDPGILRAGELYALKRVPDARREWNYTTQRMNKAQLLKAATLANQWGWHNRAITTLAQAQYWDDLELRFPLAHQKQVLIQAKKQNINPAWAFAVIRQESAFTSDAQSHAGAMGLMQLLPRTARRVALSMRIPMRNRSVLLNSDTNIQLGVSYLRKVQDRYNGHPVLATAAYNAGATHVKRWLPEQASLPADIWIELVPFEETRNYMKRVLTYTVIYEQRLGLSPVPLLDRMTPIPVNPSSTTLSRTTITDKEKKARRS